MHSFVTSKNVKWCHFIWPTLYAHPFFQVGQLDSFKLICFRLCIKYKVSVCTDCYHSVFAITANAENQDNEQAEYILEVQQMTRIKVSK